MADRNRNSMGNTLRNLGNMTGGVTRELTDIFGDIKDIFNELQTGQVTVSSQKQKQEIQRPVTQVQETSKPTDRRQMRDRRKMGRDYEAVRDSAGNIIHSPYELNDYDEEPELKNGYKREHTDAEVYKRQNAKLYDNNIYDQHDYDDVDVNVKEPLFEKGNKKQLKRAMIYKEVLGRPKGW